MKRNYCLMLVAFVLFVFASNSFATVIMDPSTGGDNLYQIYNDLYGTNYTGSNQLPQLSHSSDSLWVETSGQVLIEVRYGGFSQELGYFYDGGYTSLISAINWGYNYTPVNINVPNGGPFSWVDVTSGGTWYSSDLLNSDSQDHFIALTTPHAGEYILAFEDWPVTLGDQDYNDLVLRIDNVASVPEPSTLFLLGAGLAGVGLLRRRFKN
jgi:hypothetical protein